MKKQRLKEQHAHLLLLGREIEVLLLSKANQAVLAEKINDYIELVREHFHDEEQHLLEQYPEQFNAHVREHRCFQRRLFTLCSEPAEAHNKFSTELLTRWWIKHIQEVDVHYLGNT